MGEEGTRNRFGSHGSTGRCGVHVRTQWHHHNGIHDEQYGAFDSNDNSGSHDTGSHDHGGVGYR